MRLVDELEQRGQRLFRHRGSLPTLLLLPVVLAAVADAGRSHWSHRADLVWEIACFLVALSGLAIRVAVSGTVAEGTSGRNTSQRADDLNTTGAYSLVRHPLYLANFLVGIGLALQPRIWYLPLFVALLSVLYYERVIIAEEAFLEKKFGERFRAWAEAVPIVVPGRSAYVPTLIPFSWRAAVRREFYGTCAIVLIFFLLDVAEDLVHDRRLVLDSFWTPLLVAAIVAFLVLRSLKHGTDILRRR